jgi:uncharacterized damage-inducible protein DinB
MTENCMKRLIVMLVLLAAPGWAEPVMDLLTPEEWIGDWKMSRQFTLAVADAMPAEHYGFKPVPEQMSFGQQMLHIAYSTVYRFHQLTGAKPPFPPDQPPPGTDKPAVMKLLGQSFDYVLELLPKLTPEQVSKTLKVDWQGRPEANGRQMMLNMFVHAAHHRAQCEVYLRLKGIAPPAYRF